MARNYPKFLFQHVTAGKNVGRFIVHLLSPRCLFQVEENGKDFNIKVVEKFEDVPNEKIRPHMERASEWYIANHRKVDDGDVDLFPVGRSLKDAFILLYSERGIYKRLGLAISTISTTKKNMKSNLFPTDNLMKEQLLKAGWIKVSEELWSKINIE